MDIIVCVKPVPNKEKIYIDKKKGCLIRDGAEMVINEYDKYALEFALQCKEQIKESQVKVLSMAGKENVELLHDLYGYGVNEVFLLSDPLFKGSDTLATSYVLKSAIIKLQNCKAIFCGCETSDGCTGQVGPNLAQQLNFKLLANVIEIKEVNESSIVVKQLDVNGERIVEAAFPVVITSVNTGTPLRTKKLQCILEAKCKDVIIWNSENLDLKKERCGLKGSPTQVKKIEVKTDRKFGINIEGSHEEKTMLFSTYLYKWYKK